MAERHQHLWVHQICLWAHQTRERPAGYANRRGAAFFQVILIATSVNIGHAV
jgi:hypothetical protein